MRQLLGVIWRGTLFFDFLAARPGGQKSAKFGALGLSRATGPLGKRRFLLAYARVNGTSSRGPLRYASGINDIATDFFLAALIDHILGNTWLDMHTMLPRVLKS